MQLNLIKAGQETQWYKRERMYNAIEIKVILKHSKAVVHTKLKIMALLSHSKLKICSFSMDHKRTHFEKSLHGYV